MYKGGREAEDNLIQVNDTVDLDIYSIIKIRKCR
jgi:hypothetical protein